MEKENITKYNIIQPLVLSACVAVGMMVGFKMNDKAEDSLVSTADYPLDSLHKTGRVEELIRFIDSKYIDTINSDVLIDEAVNGLFSKLDPHSLYLSPLEVLDATDQMDGAYNGIGIENYFIDDTVNISKVLPQSPAEKAGLKIFDKIISIDDKVVSGQKMEYSTIREMLRKEEGKVVAVKILRKGKILEFKITVAEVPVKTVVSALLPDINTAWIRIDRFGSNTYKEFMEEVEKQFGEKKAKHLILDLRDNPGGYLPEATNILCQIFEEKDRLLLFTEGRNSKRNEYKSNGKRFFPIEKVIVLIDENSASASEIIAGAIQDWDRGIIVGRRSYGKGLVQEQYDLNNGGAIRLTVARYFTPSGRSIQRDYTERGKYDEDINDRYQHGDLFHKDSSIVKNGGKYYTQLLKREVSGSGGITPDEFIALPAIYKNPDAFAVKSFLPEFVFKYLASSKSEISNSDDIKMWKVPNEFYDGFKKFLLTQKDEFKDEASIPDLRQFEDEIKNQAGLVLQNPVNGAQVISENDNYIKEAIKLIKTNKKVEDYKE